MVKKPSYPAASRRVSFIFNEDDDVRLFFVICEQRGMKDGVQNFFSERECRILFEKIFHNLCSEKFIIFERSERKDLFIYIRRRNFNRRNLESFDFGNKIMGKEGDIFRWKARIERSSWMFFKNEPVEDEKSP